MNGEEDLQVEVYSPDSGRLKEEQEFKKNIISESDDISDPDSSKKVLENHNVQIKDEKILEMKNDADEEDRSSDLSNR